jgi:phytoene dehydrogenase-like protein
MDASRYIIPGGSAGHYYREGYTFDVGSSMMFGMGSEGTTNLITRALQAVGKRLDTVPDPTQIHYHLPRSSAHPQVLSRQCARHPCNSVMFSAAMRVHLLNVCACP